MAQCRVVFDPLQHYNNNRLNVHRGVTRTHSCTKSFAMCKHSLKEELWGLVD